MLPSWWAIAALEPTLVGMFPDHLASVLTMMDSQRLSWI